MKNWLTMALALGAWIGLLAPGMAQEEKAGATPIYEMRFAPGEKAPFLGIFTHAETMASMEDKIAGTAKFLESNPHLTGVTIKIRWLQFHPEKDVVKWDELEKLVDLYAEIFPQKWLSVVISQMYGSDPKLPDEVVAYFMQRCQGRAVLQTHQLNGREDTLSQSSRLCQEYADRAPYCQEMVGSFKEEADRQGTPEMTVYNFVKMGNPLVHADLGARCT